MLAMDAHSGTEGRDSAREYGNDKNLRRFLRTDSASRHSDFLFIIPTGMCYRSIAPAVTETEEHRRTIVLVQYRALSASYILYV
jgi:hypothetical protein